MKQSFTLIMLVLFITNLSYSQQDTLVFKYRRMAVDYQQSVKMAKKNLEGANSLVEVAKTDYLPKIDLNGDYNYMGNPLQLGGTTENPDGQLLYNKYQLGLWVSQPVWTGGYLKNTKNVLIAQTDVARNYIGVNEQNTMMEADLLYLNAVSKKEINLLAIMYRQAIEEFLKVIQDRVDEEIAGMNELYQVKVRYNDAQYEEIRKEKEFRVSLMQLNRLIGVPLETESQHVVALLVVNWSQYTESGVDRALEIRPEMKVKKSEVMVNQYDEKKMASRYNPKVDIGLGVTYGAPSPELLTEPGSNYLVMAHLSVPVFYWGQKNKQVFAKQMETEQTNLELERTKDLIKLQVASGYYELQRSQKQVDFASSALDNSEKNVEVMLDRYQEGLSSVLEVLDAELFWQKTYMNYIKAKLELNMAYSSYLKATGELSVTQ